MLLVLKWSYLALLTTSFSALQSAFCWGADITEQFYFWLLHPLPFLYHFTPPLFLLSTWALQGDSYSYFLQEKGLWVHVFIRQCQCKHRQRASPKPWPPRPEEHWQKQRWTPGGVCVCALRSNWIAYFGVMLLVPNTASTELMERTSPISLPRPGRSSEEVFLCCQEPYELTNFNVVEGLCSQLYWTCS